MFVANAFTTIYLLFQVLGQQIHDFHMPDVQAIGEYLQIDDEFEPQVKVLSNLCNHLLQGITITQFLVQLDI